MVYLDHNATSPPLPEVVDEVSRVLRDVPWNPGSRHTAGRKARQVLEQSRETIAGILGAHPDELIFTSGGTESINLAIHGLVRTSGVIATPPGEHPATEQAIAALEGRGFAHLELPIDANGCLQQDAVSRFEPGKVALVSVLLAHNETGVIQDVTPLAEFCGAQRVPLHLDAVQAVGKIEVDFAKLDVAALSFAAHKFQGPRGIGGLLVRRGERLQPILYGGGQEEGRRPGTEPVALAAGMAKALEVWHTNREATTAQIRTLRDRLHQVLRERCAPVHVHGEDVERLPNTLNIAFPGCDGDALLVGLDLAGVCASLGSACASGSTEPSPILVAMKAPSEIAGASLRISLGPQTTPPEIERAATAIAEVVGRLRSC